MNNKEKNILRYISIGLYLISLTQKSYCTQADCSTWGSGFYALIIGWLGLFVGGAYICWFANPLLIISWIFFKRKNNLSIILSGLSTALCFAFLFFDKIMVDEAGHYGQIIGYRIGYWLWTMSSTIFFLGNIWLRK